MSTSNCTILFAITSHGLGHLTRAIAVLRELLDLYPDSRAIVSTHIDEHRVARELERPFQYRRQSYEPGAAQINCFETDVAGTRDAYAKFFDERKARLQSEIEFLTDAGCDAVLSDIPALPIRAAATRGIPAIGIASFTWDWILQPMFEGSGQEWIVDQLREDYSNGSLYLQLPLGSEESSFPHAEAIPMVGRKARVAREETRARLGLKSRRKLILVCPGGWGASDWPAIEVADTGDYQYLFVGDLPIRTEAPSLHLPHDLPEGVGFADLVLAADVVLTKPGYGIASECIVQQTPLVGIERLNFRETPELVRALQRSARFSEISLANFFAGRWTEALEMAIHDTTKWLEASPCAATVVARRVGSFLGLVEESRSSTTFATRDETVRNLKR